MLVYIMKHIFLIHSSITYLASLSVISTERIAEDDCIILGPYRLGFEEVLKQPIIYLDEIPQLKSNYKASKHLFEFVEKICAGDDYYLYIPGMSMKARVLATSPECKGLRFIEEGTAAYQDYNILDLSCEYPANKKWSNSSMKEIMGEIREMLFLAIKGISLKQLALPWAYTAYTLNNEIIFYGFSEKSFVKAQNKKIIDIKNELTMRLKNKLSIDNEYVWISSKMFKPHNASVLLDSFAKKIVELRNEHAFNHIYIKFHQFEPDYSKGKTFELFDNLNIEYTVVEDSTMMEIEFMKNRNVTAIGDVSSLLLYNTVFGNNSISLIKGLESYYNIRGDFYQYMQGVKFI